MLPLVTTKIKDDTLQWLCANVRLGEKRQTDLAEMSGVANVEVYGMKAILDNFQEIGLINILKYNQTRTTVVIILTVKAHDLLQNGGFAVLEALTEANIQKILLELENLQKQIKPDQMDVFNKVASILSSIATVYTAFTPKD